MADIPSRIINSIRGGSGAAHAYIVEGRNAEERGFFIKNFAKSILCACPSTNMMPCGRCPACVQVEAGTSMDVVHMDRSKTNYTADDATAFSSRLAMGAYGKHLIGIIDEADKLSEIVQNKLLKTLEEPEEGALIILGTANADNLLSTVRSRCGTIRMHQSEEDEESVDVNNYITKIFFKYRDAVDKNITSADQALELLSKLEELRREAMVKGGADAEGHAAAIELIENTRKDIYKGMQYGKALKRLYLELAE